MCLQAIPHEDKETNTKVYISQAISSNHALFLSHSNSGHTGEQPESNLPGPIYAEITAEESKDPTYASVGVATGKYTYNITTNTSYDTVMLQNMNPNTCYGITT